MRYMRKPEIVKALQVTADNQAEVKKFIKNDYFEPLVGEWIMSGRSGHVHIENKDWLLWRPGYEEVDIMSDRTFKRFYDELKSSKK